MSDSASIISDLHHPSGIDLNAQADTAYGQIFIEQVKAFDEAKEANAISDITFFNVYNATDDHYRHSKGFKEQDFRKFIDYLKISISCQPEKKNRHLPDLMNYVEKKVESTVAEVELDQTRKALLKETNHNVETLKRFKDYFNKALAMSVDEKILQKALDDVSNPFPATQEWGKARDELLQICEQEWKEAEAGKPSSENKLALNN